MSLCFVFFNISINNLNAVVQNNRLKTLLKLAYRHVALTANLSFFFILSISSLVDKANKAEDKKIKKNNKNSSGLKVQKATQLFQ